MSSKHLELPSQQRSASELRNTALLRRGIKLAAFYLLMLVLSVPFIFPFLWMISSSFKNATEIFTFPPTLLPRTWMWENFRDVFTYQPFARQYANSLYISTLATCGVVFISALSGYSFARLRFPGRSVLFLLLLSALMLPGEVTIIPNFELMKLLHLTNTHIPLIVIPILGVEGVMGTFLMRQFFLGLPREIEESAMLDGLGRFGVFWHIALPMARAAASALAVITFLNSWNAFLEPLVFLDDLQLFTLPLALRNFTDSYGLPVWNLQLAATTLTVIPILVVYIFAQRFIVESFAMSGVKG